MNTDKKCALIRQTWYESAKNNLRPEERLCFYETCFEYEFYQVEPNRDNIPFSSVLLLFDMVKDYLEQDRQKAETIAMRNRRNGLKGGRPKNVTKDETQEEPKKTQKTQVDNLGNHYTTLHNTTSQNNSILSTKPKNIEEIEKFRIGINFFANGVINPAQEVDRFWSYYSARGWCINKDTPIQDRVALAKIWKAETTDGGLIGLRTDYAKLMLSLLDRGCTALELLEDFRCYHVSKEDRCVILTFAGSNRCVEILENNYLQVLQEWMPEDEQGKFNLTYSIRP